MESIQVKDYMNHYPVTFTTDMVIEEAAIRFLKTKQIGGPVINAQNHLVGFLSESDVLRQLLESVYFNEQHLHVEQIMQKEVLSVKSYDSIMELGQKMVKCKPKVYPVVDDNALLVGTISRSDVLNAVYSHMVANERKHP